MLPFLDVSHLPSSASFYSAVLQPLGIQYISSGHRPEGPPQDEPITSLLSLLAPAPAPTPATTVTYGTTFPAEAAILQIRGPADPSSPNPPKLSRIVIAAPSPLAVADFHAAALRANPRASLAEYSHGSAPVPAVATGPSGETRARVSDLDGNTMEVVYRPPGHYPAGYNGSTVRRTQSSHAEVSRILDWNYDVAKSTPPQSSLAMATRRPSHYADDDAYTVIRRSVTTTSTVDPTPSPRQSSTQNGLSTTAVVSTLLGVAAGAAAGAAITYGLIKKEQHHAPQQEYDPPPFQPRSAFPNRMPLEPHRSGRLLEVEKTVEKIRYPSDQYARPPLEYHHAPPSHYAPKYAPSYADVPRSREYDDIWDTRSRHSSRSKVSRAASTRSRSEAATERVPLMLTGREAPTHVSSRHSVASRSTHRSVADPERDSYVSARSHRSSSTIRPPPPHVESEVVSRSRAGSRVTTIKVSGNTPMAFPPNASRTHSLVSARGVPLPPSVAGTSRSSARGIPLPPSGVGSSHAAWDDDDVVSVAPSDSISCAGSSRRRERSYY